MKTFKRYLVLIIVFATVILISILAVDDFSVKTSAASRFRELLPARTIRLGVYSNVQSQKSWHHRNEGSSKQKYYDEIRVGVVACNDRLEEVLTLLKSAILFTSSPLRIFVFADEDLQPKIEKQLAIWRNVTNNSFSYAILPISLPASQTHSWKLLFRPCSAQRLFIPNLLKEVDSIVYLDSDTLFLGPVEDVWHQLSLMNSSHMAAMTNESHVAMRGYYHNSYNRHPIFGDFGVNAGVFLMNLTRMRAFGWEDAVMPTFTQYKDFLILGDQDIINIIFGTHPDKLLVMPCRFNYRTEHCNYGCQGVRQFGASIMHGNRMSFHETGFSQGFRAVYTAMRDYELGTDPYVNLLAPMQEYLNEAKSSPCGSVGELLVKSMTSHFKKPTFLLTVITE